MDQGTTKSLSGRVALVTGANHGIGAATAKALAARGARVVLTFLRLQDQVDPGIPEAYRKARASDAALIIDTITEGGGRAVAIEADIADPKSPKLLFDAAEKEFGPVEILVNNASGWLADTFLPKSTDRVGRQLQPVTAETFDAQFTVDARGSALLIAEFASRHVSRKSEWGRIISLISGGPHGFPEEVSYGAAKAALQSYTMSAAFELADYGVTANVVHPPVTDTGWVTDEVRPQVESDRHQIHIAQPEEVAAVIAFLASDHSGLITGNLIQLR